MCEAVTEAEVDSALICEDVTELESAEEVFDQPQPVEVESVEYEPEELEPLEDASEHPAEVELTETADTETEQEDQADYVEIVFDSDEEKAPEASENETRAASESDTAEKPKKEYDRDNSDKRFAAFSIEKEHSGQVQYNSSEIASVNKKLDDIMSKKGDHSDQAEKSISKKLGFLK